MSILFPSLLRTLIKGIHFAYGLLKFHRLKLELGIGHICSVIGVTDYRPIRNNTKNYQSYQ